MWVSSAQACIAVSDITACGVYHTEKVAERRQSKESDAEMAKQPLAEVFGFPIDNRTPEAERYRGKKLCPYNNRVPNCTKDKAENPLGVCSVLDQEHAVITCPVRFRQDWRIADDAADFFFAPGAQWTSLTEIRLNDRHGRSAGNIDVVLIAYDSAGRITDFGALEVQAVYISGNVRAPFERYLASPHEHATMDWSGQRLYPRPDYLSSSRKRLAPQLLFKGGILHSWGKKQAVAVDRHFFATLPSMDEVARDEAELAWLIYDLQLDTNANRYRQTLIRTVYTRFRPTLDRITVAEPGDMSEFVGHIQARLSAKLDGDDATPPDAPTLHDIVGR